MNRESDTKSCATCNSSLSNHCHVGNNLLVVLFVWLHPNPLTLPLSTINFMSHLYFYLILLYYQFASVLYLFRIQNQHNCFHHIMCHQLLVYYIKSLNLFQILANFVKNIFFSRILLIAQEFSLILFLYNCHKHFFHKFWQ